MNTATIVALLGLLQAGVNFMELKAEIDAKKAEGKTDAEIDAWIQEIFESEYQELLKQD